MVTHRDRCAVSRARVIAVTNQKGGSCKTATAVNLGAELAARGKRVLLVDLDPQGNASTYVGQRSDGRALLDALTTGGPLTVTRADCGVDVVAAGEWLAAADKMLAREVGAETILRTALRALPRRWDVVLIDCPPSMGILSAMALTAAHAVLVPVLTEAAALEGVALIMRTVERVRARLNPQLAVAGVIASQTNTTRLSRSVEAKLRTQLGDDVCSTVVRRNVAIAESYSHQQPIRLYAPDSIGATDYAALAAELTKRKQVTA